MDLSGYTLEPLYTDGELILYRGVHARPADGLCPSVLVVAPAGDYASPATLARLEHEYALAADLDPQWAVRPVALGRHQGRPVLVLEDPGCEPLDRRLGRPMEVGAFLRLAISLARVVGGVHAAGLIHKDIKPANVLVDSATGHVWLTGFGIASRFPRERHSPEPPESIAGTLAYMAPEQTGRMNRSIDSRADLYALGVTLYEMLTGRLPFTAADPMEWVHCHIARRPVPPAELRPDLSGAVSAIVIKLLAKTAEERYLTAAGLESDLRRCLGEWEAQHRIGEFRLGEDDTPDRLLSPEKLYGRAREIETLLSAFDQGVRSGTPQLVLVSGYSGIGKSSVVNELHKVLVPSRGLFAAGKADRYKRDIPYWTLAQALQSLIRPLLGKSEAELAAWRDALQHAVGANARFIVDLVPDAKLIIGEPPPVPALSPQDAQRRFQLVLRRFIAAFARPEHPLALFLDDLQWLDAATLDLIEELLTQPNVRHLILIGAYRHNEVGVSHPLVRKLETLRHAGAPVQDIVLAPLGREDLTQLIADAMRCEPERAIELAHLVHAKTDGNPFFALQFLSALTEEGLLVFRHADGRWSWDVDRIQAKGYTENVVDLMMGRLSRLPVRTQNALQQLACLGNVAATRTLSVLLRTSEADVQADLCEAARSGLIELTDGSCRFVHDRVREAAYSLIPEELRPEAHLRIGRQLLAQVSPEQRQEAIFEIVNHLNRGASFIGGQEEREQLAELNLIAGQRAKASTAYVSAVDYLIAGAALLPDDAWQRRHQLAFTLELHRAECEFATGALADAEQRLSALATRAADAIEHAAVARLQVDVDTTLSLPDRAVTVGLGYLRQRGIKLSAHPTDDDVRSEYEHVWSMLRSRGIEDLFDLPPMSDPLALATLDLLIALMPSAFFTDTNLRALVVLKAVNLSLEWGHSDASCVFYVMFGAIAGARFGDYQAGLRVSDLGTELVERRGLTRVQARTYLNYGNLVMPWTKHFRDGRDVLRRAFDAANDTGDVTFAAFSCASLNVNFLAAGDPLADAHREAENGLQFAEKARFGFLVDIITPQVALIRMLRGLTPRFGTFDDTQFDEVRFERHLSSTPALALPESWYWIRKLQARYFAADYASAVDAASKARRLRWAPPQLFETAEYEFYGALSHAACWNSAPAERRAQHVEALSAHHAQLQTWAGNCPENFENRAALVGAEVARIEGRDFDAMRLYEQAIRSARANGFVHNEAVANETAARFYATRGFEQIAGLYLRHARQGYLSWGADGKVRQLDQIHPQLRQEQPAPDARGTIGAPIEHLDLATVLKVSQAVSGELVLEKLVETLLRTALEHAGAERGLLLFPHDGAFTCHSEATTGGGSVSVRLREGPVSPAEVPASVLRYAARTQEIVILEDAAAENPFSSDGYIRDRRARSVLCLPLVKQGTLVAVVYLENSLAPGVFDPARMAVLKVLASEAAMALENSRLYRALEEREAKIRRLVDANIVGVVIWDLEGEALEANDAFLAIVGYSREDVVAGRLQRHDLTPAEWQAATRRAVDQIRTEGRSEVFEKEYLRKDGGRVPVLVGGAALDETRTHAVSFVLDLTERRRSQEALQRAHAELAHISRVTALGELAASIAHEVNQPIAAAITDASTCVRWLTREVPDLDEARQAAQRTVKDASRAADIIARIHRLFRRSGPDRECVNVNELVLDIVMLLRGEALRDGVAIGTALASDLPPVTGDRVQLQQVLLNLLMNSIEATKGVEGRREITVSSRPEGGDHVQVVVADTGVGLPATGQDEVFNAFFTTKPDGTGMGLSISRSIIEAHGGRLWATSNEPRGATFSFSLPVSPSLA